nr:MAG TPA: hypothetical protein [Caudoviricetes sp.]
MDAQCQNRTDFIVAYETTKIPYLPLAIKKSLSH